MQAQLNYSDGDQVLYEATDPPARTIFTLHGNFFLYYNTKDGIAIYYEVGHPFLDRLEVKTR